MFLRTHVLAVIFLFLLFFQYISNPIIFLLVAIFATMLPDIDSKNSKIGRHFRILNLFMRHRGITHSLIFLFLISILILLFVKEILLAFVFGYVLHLFLDLITIGGVRLFYPFNKKFNGIIKTGGIFENILFVFFLLSVLFIIFIRISTIL